MKLRVNLLRDNEARYQGPVSLRFAMVAGGSTAAIILLILIGIAVHRHVSTSHSLAFARDQWQRLEPEFKVVQSKQKQLRDRQALQAELGLWTSTRVNWYRVLRDLQAIVPPSVQLRQLNVSGTWDFIAAEKPADGSDRKDPPTPARRFTLSIAGNASGELADETVVQFTRSLRDAQGLHPVFETVRLQRMSRAAGGGEEQQTDRAFEIEALSAVRKLQ